MKSVTPELAAAITSGDQSPRALAYVDWDNDGYGPAGSLDDLTGLFDTASMSQQVTTATPDGVRVVEGSIAKDLTLDLAKGGILLPAGQVTYRDVSSATGGDGTTSLTVNKPASARSGDYMLLAVGTAGALARPQIAPAWTPLGQAVGAAQASDGFARTTASGWGTADVGGAWTTNGGSASDYSTGSSVGVHSHAATATRHRTLLGSGIVDADLTCTVSTPVLAAGASIEAALFARYTDTNNSYHAGLQLNTDQTVTVLIVKRVAGVQTTIGSATIAGLTHAVNAKLSVRFRIVGSTLSARAWLTSDAEPMVWHTTATDSAITAGGQIGCTSILNTGNTNTLPVAVSFDDFLSRSDLGTWIYERWCSDTEPASYTANWDAFGACPASAVIVACGGSVQHQPGVLGVAVSAVGSETVSGTSHTTPSIVTTTDGCLLVTFWAGRVAASGTWSAYTGGDTERADVIGASTVSNVNLAAATSATQPAGTYSRTATSSVATGTATMVIVALAPVPAGNGQRTAARHFDRNNTTDSPLAGKERNTRPCYIAVEYPTTTGPQQIRRFTGRTRRVTTDAAARTAHLDALDLREQMRTSFRLPGVSGDLAGMNASWLVSYAAYKSGFYAAPPPRTGCRAWWPMHGSGAPFISSTLDAGDFGAITATSWPLSIGGGISQRVRPKFVKGPWILGAYAAVTNNEVVQLFGLGEGVMAPGPSLVAADGNTGRLECWIRADPVSSTPPIVFSPLMELNLDPTQLAGNVLIDVGIDSTRKPYLTMNDGHQQVTWTPAPALPSDGLWYFLGWHWDFANNVTKMRVGTTDYTSSWVPAFLTDRMIATEGPWENEPFITSQLPISDIQITATANTTSWANASFTPTAFIDPSVLDLMALAERDPYEAWALTQELAAAEQGVSYFDEDGVYRYQTRRRLILPAAQTVQRVLTAEQSLTGLVDADAVDTVLNEITVEYTPTKVTPVPLGSANLAEVWSTTDVYTILPGRTLSIWASYNDPATSIQGGTVLTLIDPHPSPPTGFSYCTPNLAADGSGLAVTLTSQVNAQIVYADPGQAHLTIQNLTSQVIYLANNTGTPTVRIIGSVVTSTTGSSVAKDATSQSRFGVQPLKVDASKWLQDKGSADAVASGILADTKDPSPILTDLEIVADPRLQIGDRVQVQDRGGMALQRDYWITGFPREELASDGGYLMSISARPAANQFILGTGLVGVDLIGT